MPRGESAPEPCLRSERQYRDRLRSRRLDCANGGNSMTDERKWYVGVDWGSESHHVFLD